MSAECAGWTFRFSPATGATFTVHLAIADSVNDTHGYEFWMAQGSIAEKARTTRKTVNRALTWLVAEGLLVLVEKGATRHRPNRYRFVMPELPARYGPGVTGGDTTPVEPVTRGDTTVEPGVTGGVTRGDTGVEPVVTRNPIEPKLNPSKNPTAFDRFWAAYPRKTAKGSARAAWRLVAASPDEVIAGAERYRDDPNRDPEFTCHAATWLRGERWADEPLPARSNGRKPQPIDSDRSSPAGRLEL